MIALVAGHARGANHRPYKVNRDGLQARSITGKCLVDSPGQCSEFERTRYRLGRLRGRVPWGLGDGDCTLLAREIHVVIAAVIGRLVIQQPSKVRIVSVDNPRSVGTRDCNDVPGTSECETPTSAGDDASI